MNPYFFNIYIIYPAGRVPAGFYFVDPYSYPFLRVPNPHLPRQEKSDRISYFSIRIGIEFFACPYLTLAVISGTLLCVKVYSYEKQIIYRELLEQYYMRNPLPIFIYMDNELSYS